MYLNGEQARKLTLVAENLKIIEAAAITDGSLSAFIGDVVGAMSDLILSVLEEAEAKSM